MKRKGKALSRSLSASSLVNQMATKNWEYARGTLEVKHKLVKREALVVLLAQFEVEIYDKSNPFRIVLKLPTNHSRE